ncbi:ROK family protein [bacterium]|nr:MAG: ROK family protein [bacterium]
MAVYAIDAGGTRIKLGIVEGGKVIARTSLEARSDEGLGAALPVISAALRSLGDHSVDGLAIAFPSLIDGDRVVGDVGKYRDAPDLDLAAWAREEFGLPFAIDNDARMAVIGEWRHGAARGVTDAVAITLGTGIGTGVISQGSPLRGRHGSAGILGGHMTAEVGGRLCPCGNVGCWETLASTAALRGVGGGFNDYEAVFAAAERSDPRAVRVRDRSLKVWGALAVSLVHAYDPEVVVIGGGVAAAGEAVVGPIREAVRRYAWTPWGEVRVVRSELGHDAALVGCEWLMETRR